MNTDNNADNIMQNLSNNSGYSASSTCDIAPIILRFMANGKIMGRIDIFDDNHGEMPVNPTKCGYIFDGWFWDEDVWEKEYIPNSHVEKPLSFNMAVYAKWVLAPKENLQDGIQSQDNILHTPADNREATTYQNCESSTTNGEQGRSSGLSFEEVADGYAVSGVLSCKYNEIVIPATYNGKPVTAIGECAFYRCGNILSITIPNSVTTIGDFAFNGCSRITSITIPTSVTSIGREVFNGCNGLHTITVEKGNSVYHSSGDCLIATATKTLVRGCGSSVIPTDGSVTTIGEYAFKRCNNLLEITIPQLVTAINTDAFSECSNLTSVNILGKITDISISAFEECSRLISVTIPDGVTTIGNHAFCRCYSLTSVKLPDSVTDIKSSAFSYCHRLTDIKLSPTVTKIGVGAFADCIRLEKIDIPCGVAVIYPAAFRDCHSLVKVNMHHGVTTIGEYAFANCSNLASIVMPNSVTTIDKYAFLDCSCLVNIIYRGTIEDWGYIVKKNDCDCNTGEHIVHCTNGNITIRNI